MTDMPPPQGDPTPQPVNYSSATTPPGGYMGPPPTSEEKTMAMLSHVLNLVAPILAPLIIYLMKKDQSPFVADQAKESLNFQITLLLICIPVAITICIGIGVILLPAVGIAGLVFTIMAAIKANEGVAYRYPFALRLIK